MFSYVDLENVSNNNKKQNSVMGYDDSNIHGFEIEQMNSEFKETFSNQNKQVVKDEKESDGLMLKGNLQMDGNIKANSFYLSDGSKMSEVTKLALPKNVHYNKGKIGINQKNPKKALDIIGGLTVKGRTDLIGQTNVKGRICMSHPKSNKLVCIDPNFLKRIHSKIERVKREIRNHKRSIRRQAHHLEKRSRAYNNHQMIKHMNAHHGGHHRGHHLKHHRGHHLRHHRGIHLRHHKKCNHILKKINKHKRAVRYFRRKLKSTNNTKLKNRYINRLKRHEMKRNYLENRLKRCIRHHGGHHRGHHRGHHTRHHKKCNHILKKINRYKRGVHYLMRKIKKYR